MDRKVLAPWVIAAIAVIIAIMAAVVALDARKELSAMQAVQSATSQAEAAQKEAADAIETARPRDLVDSSPRAADLLRSRDKHIDDALKQMESRAKDVLGGRSDQAP